MSRFLTEKEQEKLDNMLCEQYRKRKKKREKEIMPKKRFGVYKPVERKSKPKNSIKWGETKHFLFYSKGNRTYYVIKRRKK